MKRDGASLHCLGDGEAAARGSSCEGKWNATIAKYIDLSYHDGKGGDKSTAVKHWRNFCAQAADDGSFARALETTATRTEKLAEESLIMRFACWLVVERGVQPSTAEGYISTVQAWHGRRFGCRLAGGMQMSRLRALYLQGHGGGARGCAAEEEAARVEAAAAGADDGGASRWGVGARLKLEGVPDGGALWPPPGGGAWSGDGGVMGGGHRAVSR